MSEAFNGYARYTTPSGAPPAAAVFGRGLRSVSGTAGAEVQERAYVGGHFRHVGGLFAPAGSMEFEPTDATFLALAFRSQGAGFPFTALTGFSLDIGIADETAPIMYHFTDCLINRLELEFRYEDTVVARVDWSGLKVIESTYAMPANETGTPWEWFESTATALSTDIGIQSIRFIIENTPRPLGKVTAGASPDKRQSKSIQRGVQRTSVEFNSHKRLTSAQLGILTDAILSNLGATCAANNGTTTLTATFANGSADPTQIERTNDEGEYEHITRFTAPGNTASSLTIAVA